MLRLVDFRGIFGFAADRSVVICSLKRPPVFGGKKTGATFLDKTTFFTESEANFYSVRGLSVVKVGVEFLKICPKSPIFGAFLVNFQGKSGFAT